MARKKRPTPPPVPGLVKFEEPQVWFGLISHQVFGGWSEVEHDLAPAYLLEGPRRCLGSRL
jgi:hypothetical protein